MDDFSSLETQQETTAVQATLKEVFTSIKARLGIGGVVLDVSIQRQASRASAKNDKSVEVVGTNSRRKPQEERDNACRSLNTEKGEQCW
jgi:hypothetical protein